MFHTKLDACAAQDLFRFICTLEASPRSWRNVTELLARTAPGLLASVLVLVGASHNAHAAPSVVVSIAPLHSLVAGVMQGVGNPSLLMQPGDSEHSAALRPSGARALQSANLVVRVGPQLERSLTKPIANLVDGRTEVIDVMAIAGMKILPFRTARTPDEDDHNGEGAHDHVADDPHVWLDPDNARLIVVAVADALVSLDAANATRYHENKANSLAGLAALHVSLTTTLAPVRAKRHAVFHDAWQYLENAYGLGKPVILNHDPVQSPSVAQRRRVERELGAAGVKCIFAEPQFDGKLVASFARQFKMQSGVLDPLGAKLSAGPDLYTKMMRNIAASLAACR